MHAFVNVLQYFCIFSSRALHWKDMMISPVTGFNVLADECISILYYETLEASAKACELVRFYDFSLSLLGS